MFPIAFKGCRARAFFVEIPPELQSMLDGEHGPTKQKTSRLVVDLAASAGASEFTRCTHAHVSGVSVITGGHGLRRFLSDLSGDQEGVVSIPTTLNSAGCDREQMEEMGQLLDVVKDLVERKGSLQFLRHLIWGSLITIWFKKELVAFRTLRIVQLTRLLA